ncbi:helix-turn-helix domain-containing protein, partial [Staphylococcus capitis]|uniref:helix-turn-helix domain-containing protein n=1 Tax=Staphylococcus capitis TaxID=29388 RepID=UPI003CFD312D
MRVDAGLTARALSHAMGCHGSKISRIEHGVALPSVDDIRAWCVGCAAQDHADDLIATLRAVDGMWIEWRRIERSGLRLAQASLQPLYERTRVFRVYSPSILPGLVQTEAYTAAVLRAIMRRRALHDDVDEAVTVRMARQRVLNEGDHRFVFLIEESALTVGFGGPETMAAQLGHLIVVSALPSVSLGIIPTRPDRDGGWPVEGFWMFDMEQVAVELVSGHLTVTQPR